MRLATWNCQTGLASKWGVVEKLGADVLTVQECGSKTEEQVGERDGWTCKWQVGRYPKIRYPRGVAVLADSRYKIETVERSEPCLISSLISGPDRLRFRFVGFWAMTPPTRAKDGYAKQATHLIEQLAADDIPTIVAGDFNASWRNEYHLKNVERLRARGLKNAYNSFYSIGDDVDPVASGSATSYVGRKASNPFHMDFVFVTSHWSIQSVEVGNFEDYPGRRISDHVPIVVSITPEQTSA